MRIAPPFALALMTAALVSLASARAQDMLRFVDLDSPEMKNAEMTSADLDAMVQSSTPGKPLDLSNKRLSGLDLSGRHLSGAVFRAAKLNRTNLTGA
ncbi:MAG: pentapeptide repeat-containing protein, partial [Hyphomicrobiales bacterium]|nr:pentapeptide repeat-containing protein [Hyphomicrobiales bacterium]